MFRTKLTAVLILVATVQLSYAQSNYVPTATNWERRTPEQAKMDAVKLKEAIDFAIASEARGVRSQELGLHNLLVRHRLVSSSARRKIAGI